MPDKQYVNLPQGSADNHGRWYLLSIKIAEKKPGDSEGRLVYLFVDAQPDNLPDIWFPAAHRGGGFQFTPPGRTLQTVKDKKAEAYALLSIGGGDKYKFRAGKKASGDGSVDARKEVEVWRKIWVRVGNMKGCPSGNWGTVKSEFQKVFLDLEQQGPTEIPHLPWSRDRSPVTEMDKGKGALPYPDQATKLVFVDRIGKSSRVDVGPISFTPAQLKNNRVFKYKLPGTSYTWPDDSAWIAGRIEILDKNGRVTASYDKVRHTVSKRTSSEAYKHPEGWAARYLKFDFSGWGKLDAWCDRGEGQFRFTLWVWMIDDTAMGLAWPSPPQILIATRDPRWYTLSGDIDNTIVHEIGHNLGLNVRWLPTYDEATGAFDDWDENSTWYDNRNGGVGTHCSTGATLGADSKYKNGTCTMLHYVNGITAFCDQCSNSVKRAKLTKLGKGNVWPAG